MFAALESFALEGLTLPAFNIAMGAWLILIEAQRKYPPAEELDGAHPFVRYLVTRPRIERPVGAFLIILGILIAVQRLTA